MQTQHVQSSPQLPETIMATLKKRVTSKQFMIECGKSTSRCMTSLASIRKPSTATPRWLANLRAVLKFARPLPLCSCHVRTEDVTISTRTTAKGEVETRYSLKDDALIYTPKQIWQDYLNKVVPISALESPRDRGSGFTPAAANYKQQMIAETLLHEQTLAAMNDLYSENLILAAHIEQLNDNISAQDAVLAYEQAKTAETKELCAQELADLHTSLTEGSLKSLTLTYTSASNCLYNLISNTYYAFCRESYIKKIT